MPPSSPALPALAEVAPRLRCPHCAATPLACEGSRVLCPAGHSFDVARQGYVSLLAGARRHPGDDAAMVAARERFLSRDHYRPLRSALADLVAGHAPAGDGLVVDLAGGTGHYLAAVLDGRPAARGLTVDLSSAALRRAARAHPRAAAIAADVWAPLPLRSGAASVVLSVFGPRDAGEIERVLDDGGILAVASAAPEHHQELRAPLGALGIDPRKRERLDAALGSFTVLARRSVHHRLDLARDEVEELVTMGPSAHHLDGARLRAALARLTEPVGVTVAVDITVLTPPHRLDSPA